MGGAATADPPVRKAIIYAGQKTVNMADGINPRVFYGQIKLSLGGVAHLDRLLGCTATIGVCVADGQYTPLGGWTVQWHQPSRNHLEDSYRYCQP